MRLILRDGSVLPLPHHSASRCSGFFRLLQEPQRLAVFNSQDARLRERSAAFKTKCCTGELENYRNRTIRSPKHRYRLYFDGTEERSQARQEFWRISQGDVRLHQRQRRVCQNNRGDLHGLGHAIYRWLVGSPRFLLACVFIHRNDASYCTLRLAQLRPTEWLRWKWLRQGRVPPAQQAVTFPATFLSSGTSRWTSDSAELSLSFERRSHPRSPAKLRIVFLKLPNTKNDWWKNPPVKYQFNPNTTANIL